MEEGLLATYLRDLARVRRAAEATPELSLREPLLRFVREVAAQSGRPNVLVAPEADAEQAGQPDVFIKDGPRLVGFIETKAPGTDIGRWLSGTRQSKRYRDSLPNWVVTDYYRFIFIRDGEEVAHVTVADPLGVAQLTPPDEEARVVDEFAKFLAYAPPIVRSPQRLALELARRARLLRDAIEGALAIEPADGRLRGILGFYRETLMSDLDEAGFADTFAQTIAYGLFLGRLRSGEGEFTLPRAVSAMPQSVPLLRSTVRLLTDEEVLPGPISRLLEDLVALLDNTKIDPIREEVAAGGLERDLVVYFYERFLEQYDAGERKKRGVYYTPPELVDFLLRATETILHRDFELPRALADEAVTVLDPAVGTGTFLLGAAERALTTEAGAGSAIQRRLIREHLLPDFYGFELLPAPYAIAHLKVSAFYAGRGYELANDERVRVFLTNTLEPHEIEDGQQQLTFLPMVRGIVEEARAASHVKEHVPVLVIIGNPPYERTSHNDIEHSNALLEDFYSLDGVRIRDRNTGPLRDDYLRFIRWGVWKLLEQEGAPWHGILAFVTNRAYLERKLHRAVRRFLLERFDDIYVFDLHGDQREWFADRVDEKVFKEVQAGIALSVFVKRPGPASTPARRATVAYRDTFGRRSDKYAACRSASIDDDGWQVLAPREPLWLFVPYDAPAEYDTWPSIADVFPTNVVGFQTHRDQLVVAFTENELRERLERFADSTVPDDEWERQGVKRNRDWDLATAREALRQEAPRHVMPVTYRGLERRWTAMDVRLIDYIRTAVSPHLLARRDNLAIVFATGSLPDGAYVTVSRTPVPAAALSWRTFGAAYFAPLYLRNELNDEWAANLPSGFLDRLAAAGIDADPDAVLDYAYAVLNAPFYRERYRDALRYDFARIPFARDPASFAAVRELGRDLVLAHLLEHRSLDELLPAMEGDDRAILEAPTYDAEAKSIRLAATLSALSVEPAEWQYQQGAYPVLRDFVDSRRGRTLSREEFDEFRRLVAAVRFTVRLLPRLDEILPGVVANSLTAEDLGLSSER